MKSRNGWLGFLAMIGRVIIQEGFYGQTRLKGAVGLLKKALKLQAG